MCCSAFPHSERERRRRGIVRASFERDRRRGIGMEERRQDRLEDERHAARASDVEAMVAGLEATRRERERLRSERVTFDHRIADLLRGANRGEMLAKEAGLRPARADLLDAERTPRHDREAERGAQDLSPALPSRSVEHEVGQRSAFA